MKNTSLLALFGTLSAAAFSHAAVVSSFDTGTFAEISPAVSSTDLLETNLSGSAISGFDPVGAYEPSLADGGNLFDGSGNTDGHAYGFGEAYIDNSTASEWSATFTLDTSVNALGYDLTAVNAFSGWDSGLASQDFTIELSLVNSADFVTVGRFTQAASDSALVLSVTEDSSGIIASGVDEIRFTHHTASGDARGSYRELDVIGTATAVPEPSTYAVLLGLASMAGVFLFRKRV